MTGAPQPLAPVPGPPTEQHPGGARSRLPLLRSLRPRQWTKNLALFAPLLFARRVDDSGDVLRASLGVLAFCALAGGVYLLNDWVDRDKDRLHPEKQLRPIASGEVGAVAVFTTMAICLALAGGLSAALGPTFGLVAFGYLALQLAYTFALKHWVVIDVVAIALGFVLRVVAGGVAIGVPVSNWLYLCTLLLAVFLACAKRRHELASLQQQAAAHRANLSQYTVPLLDQMIGVSASSCIVAYGLYTVSRDTVEHVGSDDLKLTVPFVIYGIFRYLFLIHGRGAGGSPERVLLSDVPMLVNLALFVGVASWVLYR